MAREVNLWNWLRDGLAAEPALHMTRIENAASSGMPDVEGCWASAQFWLELKAADRPVDPTSRLDLAIRPLQVRWGRRRWRADGCCWFYVQVGSGAAAARYLVRGIHGEELRVGVSEPELVGMSVLPPDHGQRDLLLRAVTRSGVPLLSKELAP